ncbi:hypothetical protein JOE48_005915 [Methylobacterium sp. PvR107]|nr:hypothetical protein [Methylobacterium sp. PvR107]
MQGRGRRIHPHGETYESGRKHTQRARIVLLSAERLNVQDGARRAGVEGLLRDKTRPPGTPPHSTETVAEVLALTCSEPPGEVTHWTGRAVARAVGISLRAVQRIFDAHRLLPHRLRSFKRSRDPAFAAKVENGPPSNLFDGIPAWSAWTWTHPPTAWCGPSTRSARSTGRRR